MRARAGRIWAILLVAAASAAAGEARAATGAQKATIAVLSFDDGTYGGETDALTDALTRVLVNTRKFDVVERSRLAKVARERRFISSGYADVGAAASLGRYLGADYLVMGNLLDHSISAPKEMPYGMGLARQVRVSVDLQVVETHSGRVVAAKRASSTSQALGGDNPGNDAIERAAEETARQVVAAVLDVAFPIKIIHVGSDTVHLNRGSEESGLVAGSRLSCFGAGGALRDPDTGETLGAAEVPGGTIALHEVLAKFSTATVIENHGLAVGDVCRPALADSATADRRAPTPNTPIYSY